MRTSLVPAARRAAGVVLAAALLPGAARAQHAAAAPPNAPATVHWDGAHLSLDYDGHTILAGTARADRGTIELRELSDTVDGAVTEVAKLTVRGGDRLTMDAAIRASGEAFAAEADRPTDAPAIVRTTDGPSRSLLDRAVYDRRDDWVVSVDFPARATVVQDAAAADSSTFALHAEGFEIAIRFRPRFYQRHRGLAYYRPWTYRPWPRSVAGWTSWFAFLDTVTEADIRRTAGTLDSVLRPFGYDYLQVDDGYERQPIGLPANWLHANAKFPSGLDGLERMIAAHGLEPGIWTNVTFHDSAWAAAHARYFVRTADGAPAYGNWIGFVLDGSAPGTMDSIVLPVYRALAAQGWRYFKVDALRHLRYEGYNSHAGYFRARHEPRDRVYRELVQRIRDAIGPDAFLLGSWGIRPELAGLLDACRVGTDGFGYGGFAEYNSYNNVVWRNDPDHIQIAAPDAYRATTITALTGSLLMLTDPPAVYHTDRVEAAKRAAPVPVTRPGQLYDLYPGHSDRIARANVELSGSGPRPLDADQRVAPPMYLLEVSRPFEDWMVLARTHDDGVPVRFADLGLDPAREYWVFEFWSRTLLGHFTGAFAAGAVDPRFGVQDLCIRERVDHPQLLATSRHVTCGGPDLRTVAWRGGELAGTSELVAADPYVIWLTEPAGWRYAGATVEDARIVGTTSAGGMRAIRLISPAGGVVRWRIRWQRVPGDAGTGAPR